MPLDTCANYNAFGRDPIGLISHLAAWFFGPDWIPPFPAQVFGGPPEPPRYGPPAAYQLKSLPSEFVANPPPEYFGPPTAPFLEPPAYFHPSLFDGLRFSSQFYNLEEEYNDGDWGTDFDEDNLDVCDEDPPIKDCDSSEVNDVEVALPNQGN